MSQASTIQVMEMAAIAAQLRRRRDSSYLIERCCVRSCRIANFQQPAPLSCKPILPKDCQGTGKRRTANSLKFRA